MEKKLFINIHKKKLLIQKYNGVDMIILIERFCFKIFLFEPSNMFNKKAKVSPPTKVSPPQNECLKIFAITS